ncbi:type I-E CRISPR-associated protein Cas6/Cse3/CasE [Methylocaldum sp. RMAD-M]|uniref:type I-E CRISPR-associated protein Cas6/Cse3/CasE n=1 Tax=unclassified Methylocaldum TaxID=2622260 RepID=UPI00143DED89|nr:CRISPR system Cascade subunit CasE [Methylocaldum sp. RMAD-M]
MRYFSKAVLDLSRREARECLLELDNPYREHQLLWRLFPDTARREFLFTRASGGQTAYYLVSPAPPAAPSSAWMLESREYRPNLAVGDRLEFRLRANPIVARRQGEIRTGGKARTHRHDVVMEAKRALNWKTLPENDRPPLAEVIQRAGTAWLAARAAKYGFHLDTESLEVDGYEQHRFLKKGDKPVTFSTLDFQGELTVTEPIAFVEHALFSGIGPAKAFGCGLLLVRRLG